MPHALLVDDNRDTLDALTEVLKAEGFTASTAPNLDEAKAALARQNPDVVLLDLNLPDGSGMSLLDGIEGIRAPAVVLITGHASVSTVVEALRRGVTDYLTKPVDVDRLRQILGNIAHTRQLPDEIKSLQTERDQSGRFGLLVGRSANMRRTFELIARIAPSSASVLISGESGTGKDVVARTIHALSRRRHGPFVPVNCGAISAALLESELFGHERGSFTGADRRHRGYFERAHRGTLFLDEVTEMPLELQVKLLRVIESGSFFRVGAEQPISVDVRILAASNRDVLRVDRQRPDAGGPLLPPAGVRAERVAAARAPRRRRAAGAALPRRSRAERRRAQGDHDRRPWRRCRATPGPATCATCATWSSRPTSSPTRSSTWMSCPKR